MEKHTCCVTVFGDRRQNWQCQKNATVERDKKWYCGTHDPEKVKARDAARDEKWRKEGEEQEANRKRQAALNARRDLCATACADIPDAALAAGVVGQMRMALDQLNQAIREEQSDGALVKYSIIVQIRCQQARDILAELEGN